MHFSILLVMKGYWMILLSKIDSGLTSRISHMKNQSWMTLVAQCNLTQIIHEPAHILEFLISYIDLALISQENSFTDPGVLSSLHPDCLYQMVFSNFNLNTVIHLHMLTFDLKIRKKAMQIFKKSYKRFRLGEYIFFCWYWWSGGIV